MIKDLDKDEPGYSAPRKVYLTNQGWHDYSPAQRYGELVPITIGKVDNRHTDRLRAYIHQAMEDMTSKDFLLLSGNPLVVAECTAYLMAKFGKVTYLYWEPLMNDYLIRTTTGGHYDTATRD